MSPGWYAGPDERGATLLELLVGLAVGILVLSAALVALTGLGRLVSVESLLLRQHEQVDVLAPLLVAWVAGAGCGRSNPVAALEVAGDRLSLEADTDGEEGFPDGLLEGSFETVTLLAARGNFRVGSKGGAAQPAAEGLDSAAFERPAPHLVRVDLQLTGRADGLGRRRVELWIRLPNLEHAGAAGPEGSEVR